MKKLSINPKKIYKENKLNNHILLLKIQVCNQEHQQDNQEHQQDNQEHQQDQKKYLRNIQRLKEILFIY